MVTKVFQSLVGIFREQLTAYFFGVSANLSIYLTYRSASDFFGTLGSGNALQGNLMPLFIEQIKNNKQVNLSIFYKKLFSILVWSTIIIFTCIFIVAYIRHDFDRYSVSFIVLLLIFTTLSSSLNIVGGITIVLVRSLKLFNQFSISSVLNSVVNIMVLPLAAMVKSVVIIPFARFLGIFMQLVYNLVVFKRIRNDLSLARIDFFLKDFNLIIILFSNWYLITFIISRFLFGIEAQSNLVVYFNYSFFLLNAFNTIFSRNLITIILGSVSEGTLKIKKQFQIGTVSFLISFLFLLVLYRFKLEVIAFVFERGEYTTSDSLINAEVLSTILLPFLIHTTLPVFYQSLFVDEKKLKLVRRYFVLALIIITILTIALFYVFNFTLGMSFYWTSTLVHIPFFVQIFRKN